MAIKEVDKNLIDVPDDPSKPNAVRLSDGTAFITTTGGALDVNLTSPVTVDVSLDEANDSVAVYGNDGGTNRILKTDAAGELQVDVVSSALPTGAATEATLSTLNGKVTAVDTDDVTITNAAGASAVNIQDGGNSITVDGSVTVTATNLDVRDLTHVSDSIRLGDGTDLAEVTAAGELNVLATAQPGVDIGDVTINNAAGASAVNIQDGGNSITVDGTVTSNIGTTGGLALDATVSGIDTTLTDASQKTQIVDGSGNVIGATANALDVNIASGTINTDLSYLNDGLGANAFDLSDPDTNNAGVDVNGYVSGSFQFSWSGATSSNAFATPGVMYLECSNDGTNWEEVENFSVGAASGTQLARGMIIDFRYIRTRWDQNTSTAGTSTAVGVFKAA